VKGDKDWRLQGQEEYLQGATLLRKPYKAGTEEWDHDHCEFCWTTFVEPALSPKDPEILTEGYSVQGRGPDASSGGRMGRVYADDKKTIHSKRGGVDATDYWWVCPTCVKDFAQRFEWVVLEEPVSPRPEKRKAPRKSREASRNKGSNA
jgi:hypothetical protein